MSKQNKFSEFWIIVSFKDYFPPKKTVKRRRRRATRKARDDDDDEEDDDDIDIKTELAELGITKNGKISG
jgi:hypothetical protein